METSEASRLPQMHIRHFCFALDAAKGGVPGGLVTTVTQLTQFGIKNDIFSSGITRRQIVKNSKCFDELLNLGVITKFSVSCFENEYGIGKFVRISSVFNNDSAPNLVVLHQIYTLSTLLGYFYARKREIPYVVFPHGSLMDYHESNRRVIKWIAKKLIITKIIRKSHAIVVTSLLEANGLLQEFQKKIVLLPYGTEIQTDESKEQVMEVTEFNEVNLLFSGRFDRVKNLPLLIQALPAIVLKYPTLKLHIAGTGTQNEIAGLVRLIEELRIDKQIVFHGWVSKDEMRSLLRSSRVLVLPSRIENFAIVVAEALSFGVPCVVSKYVGTAEIVERHRAGKVIQDLTPDSLSRAIIDVLSGDQRTFRHAAYCAAREDFNWAKIANDWDAFLRSLTLD